MLTDGEHSVEPKCLLPGGVVLPQEHPATVPGNTGFMRGGSALAALCLLLLLPVSAPAVDKFLAMGTGSTNGVYYVVGEGICDLVNAGRLEHGIRCQVYSTGASVYNLQAIASGELDVGMTQANLAQDAFLGLGIFEDFGENTTFRSIAGLYNMPAGLIVRNDSDITTFADIRGNIRISIGNAGAGKRMIADQIAEAAGWTPAGFPEILQLSTAENERAFCNGEVDVIIEGMALPSSFLDRITEHCGGRFVSIPDDVMEKILTISPYLGHGIIPGGTYPHNPDDVSVIMIRAVLVTSSRVDPNAIYTLVKSIFSNQQKYRAVHPAVSMSSRGEMIEQGQFLPFHAGAIRYYEEIGIAREIIGAPW